MPPREEDVSSRSSAAGSIFSGAPTVLLFINYRIKTEFEKVHAFNIFGKLVCENKMILKQKLNVVKVYEHTLFK